MSYEDHATVMCEDHEHEMSRIHFDSLFEDETDIKMWEAASRRSLSQAWAMESAQKRHRQWQRQGAGVALRAQAATMWQPGTVPATLRASIKVCMCMCVSLY